MAIMTCVRDETHKKANDTKRSFQSVHRRLTKNEDRFSFQELFLFLLYTDYTINRTTPTGVLLSDIESKNHTNVQNYLMACIFLTLPTSIEFP